MKPPKRLSLEDIAEKAGVSRSTVSRVVNNDPNVKAKTRAHVLQIIEQERYNPHAAARIMVTGRTNVIGVVVPHAFRVFSSPYYFPMLFDGVGSVVQKRDYAMLLWWRQSGEDEEIFFRRILQNGLMDGLIIASAPSNNPMVEHVYESHIPMVMVERPPNLVDHISYVTIDNIGASRAIVEHLIAQGRRRIAIVSGDPNNMDGFDRLAGYKQAMDTAGLPVDPAWIANGDFVRQTAYERAKALVQLPIDAIFACNDDMAFGVYQAVFEAGKRIPDDIAVVGFDDLPSAAEAKPPLTTIRQPIREKGAAATQLLLDQIEGKLTEPRCIVLPTTLVTRQSCGELSG